MANSIFLSNGISSDAAGNSSTPGSVTAGSQATGSFYAADGTALLPAYSFSSEPTLGFWRSSAAVVTLQGALSTSGGVTAGSTIATAAAAAYRFTGRAALTSPADGQLNVTGTSLAIGSQLKVDALPTVTAGGGTSPSVTAGSTPLAGSVNVGSGAPGATITVTWGGTAFPSAPFPVCMNQTTGLAVKGTATTTTLVITPQTGNFGASDVITWICIGSK